jgi:hypothetical protein
VPFALQKIITVLSGVQPGAEQARLRHHDDVVGLQREPLASLLRDSIERREMLRAFSGRSAHHTSPRDIAAFLFVLLYGPSILIYRGTIALVLDECQRLRKSEPFTGTGTREE